MYEGAGFLKERERALRKELCVVQLLYKSLCLFPEVTLKCVQVLEQPRGPFLSRSGGMGSPDSPEVGLKKPT